ncbi:unnamed protein product [Cylicocyclus nassatus]|uniref:Uncharacterized protein n=1 Tax=Cylicocyclus nassatus TaxID=53992 RepID=A0AA36DNY9_CYLNA|nr:unnamed protein product [Cylicocyclus nassatus]
MIGIVTKKSHRGFSIVRNEQKFNLPKRYNYSRSIASYITELGGHRLWVLSGKTLYDFDLDKVERGAYNTSNPLIYKIPDKHRFKTKKI